jgi:hypothetical protein
MGKLKTRVVTGYVRLEDHTRSPAAYEKLGQRLSDALGDHPLAVYYERVGDLWLTKFIESLPPMQPPLTWAKADNPQKNSLEFHCIQHQKFEWLRRASEEDQDTDTFIWVDYGVFSQPGMNAEVIRAFLHRVRRDDFTFPGCWPATVDPVSDDYPSWRFLGSLMVVPRKDMRCLVECMQAMTKIYIRVMKQVPFEVNMMARVEPLLKKTGFRWYAADHNASQFGSYQ